MWQIYEKRAVVKAVKKAPKEIGEKYEAWKKIVSETGPDGLKSVRGFRDESLRGNWKGYRSSRLGVKWRIIYRVEKRLFEVYAVELNPHKY